MRLKIFLSIIVLFIFTTGSSLYAGVVSLTDAEVLRLQALVQASPDAELWKENIVNQANVALHCTPNPVPHIEMAGQLKGSVGKTQTQEAMKDFGHIHFLGLAYALTGNKEYFDKSAVFLIAWAKTCRPPEGPIDATQLEPLLETYDLIRPQTAPEDRKVLDDWVRSVAHTLLGSDDPTREVHKNNWQAHRLKMIAMVAFILNDTGMEKETLDSLESFMQDNLNRDGTTLDFHLRDALHYHLYDLEPLIRVAMIYQRAQNVDLYNWKTDQGASVSQCVVFVLPFTKGEQTHTEFVNSTVAFDRQRAANGEAEYVQHDFIPRQALRCLELAQYFQPELKYLAGTLCGKPGSAYPTLQCLLNEAMRNSPLPAAVPMAANNTTTTGVNPTPQGSSVLMDDFENGTGVNHFGSVWRTLMDNHQLGTTLTPYPFQPSPGGSPVSPKFAAHIWGHFGKHIAPWPFALLQGGFNPENAATDLSAFSAVRFYVKGDKKNYLLQLIQPSVKDFAYYLTAFQATTEWTQVTLPFASFQQPSWGAKVPLQWKNVRLFQFSPDTAVFSDEDYDLWIDDIELMK